MTAGWAGAMVARMNRPDPVPEPLDAESFLAAALTPAADAPRRTELHDGAVVATAPATVGHARSIRRVRDALAAATAHLPCEAIADSVAVRVASHTVFVPDVLLVCGARLAGDVAMVEDATFLVEVVSPSTAAADLGRKLAGYAALPSFRGYLVVLPDDRRAILHLPGRDGALETRLYHADQPAPPATIDPPGFALDIPALLAR